MNALVLKIVYLRKAFVNMNRLVIIGNGFDLAHGLPTSYKDFIEDYFVEKMNVFLTERVYEDVLISVKYLQSILPLKTDIFRTMDEVVVFLKRYSTSIQLSYRSPFLRKLKSRLDQISWVDVESEYFDSLLDCKSKSGIFDYAKVTKLNEEFNFLKYILEKYLLKINTKSAIVKNNYEHFFSDHIKKEDVVFKKIDNDEKPNELLFLNFNYTKTINNYYSIVNKRISTKVNFIHGELNTKENPLIFGFGDEYDKNYKEFEDERKNVLFDHIKSFGYFKTENYYNLIRFIDSDDFQVYIFGHSCGLSDRTMLKQIFENEKCISIKIFFYERPDGSNDFAEKTMDIARHFEDKGLMRKKIVPFPLSRSL